MKLRRAATPGVVIAILALLVVASVPAWSAMITGKSIKDGTVTTKDIKNNDLTTKDVRKGSLDGSDLRDGSVTGTDLGNGSVTGADVAAGSLSGAHVQDESLTGADVVNGSIAPADLAPRTEVLAVPWVSFFPGSTGAYAGYGQLVHVGRRLTGAENGAHRMHAALNLPQGSTITRVSFDALENVAGGGNLMLARVPVGSSTMEVVATADTDGASTAVRTFDVPVNAARAVIDNRQYYYVLTMFVSNWNTTTPGQVELVGARVEYTH